MKVCYNCKISKSIDNFTKSKVNRDGLVREVKPGDSCSLNQ